MNKSVLQHIEQLIEYYKECSINDAEYLKKLIVRNLNDVKKRYEKYDLPKLEQLKKE